MAIIAQKSYSTRGKANGDRQIDVGFRPDRRGCGETPWLSQAHATGRPLCACKEGNELHYRENNDTYRIWREQRGIQPWVEPRPKADKHITIRSDVKGKKKRVEVASNYNFLFDSRDVATIFAYTVDYYSNVGLVFRHKETKEYKRMSICSRWNLKKKDWYNKRYWDIYNSVKDETRVVMLSIGYDQRPMYQIMLDSGWNGDFYGYLMSRIGDDITKFLKRLRSYYKRKGWEWTYRGYAIEPYEESGLPHIHFYFAGSWIADIDDIVHLWGWSQPQGIKVTVRTGSQVAGYLSHYLRKAITCIKGNKVHLLFAYAYFFGVPLYRVAYGKRKKADMEGDSIEIKEDSIPVEKPFKKGQWDCVGTDNIDLNQEWDGRFKPFKGDGNRMSMEEYEKFMEERKNLNFGSYLENSQKVEMSMIKTRTTI